MTPDNISNLTKTSPSMETMLHNALLMTEVGMDLKERYIAGDKYVCQLKTLLTGADKAISALQFISKSSLEQAQQMLLSIVHVGTSTAFKHECDRLLTIIEKQLSDLEMRNLEVNFENLDLSQMSEKIKYLETKQKHSDNCITAHTSSSRNVKADVNEKYPENLSRESLIDLNAVVNLPTVPEDIFTSFSNKPMRSSSLSSLKSMRKIKLYLQRAESSDDEDSSDPDDHDYQKLVYGDSDDGKSQSPHSPIAKKLLGNIKEETQD